MSQTVTIIKTSKIFNTQKGCGIFFTILFNGKEVRCVSYNAQLVPLIQANQTLVFEWWEPKNIQDKNSGTWNIVMCINSGAIMQNGVVLKETPSTVEGVTKLNQIKESEGVEIDWRDELL